MATPRKVTKAAEKLEKHSAEMQDVAKKWAAASGKDKQKLLDQLRKMTSEKRDLESQLQSLSKACQLASMIRPIGSAQVITH